MPLASDQEFAMLRAQLAAITSLQPDELDAFPRPQRLELKAGSAFLEAGQRAKDVATVFAGGLREYYVLDDGDERTKSFNMPGEFAGSLSDLLSDAPSRTWVVAEVPSVLLVTPWSTYTALSESSIGWQRFARRIAEGLYLRKVEREYELLALNAEQRYRRALDRWPTLEDVFLQRHIASYLGVSAVHLSRLRKRD